MDVHVAFQHTSNKCGKLTEVNEKLNFVIKQVGLERLWFPQPVVCRAIHMFMNIQGVISIKIELLMQG